MSSFKELKVKKQLMNQGKIEVAGKSRFMMEAR